MKRSLFSLGIAALILSSGHGQTVTISAILSRFYRYDEMPNVKDRVQYGFETGSDTAVLSSEEISEAYRDKITSYSNSIEEVIDNNLPDFIAFYASAKEFNYISPKLFINRPEDQKYASLLQNYDRLIAILNRELLEKYPNCVRVMWSHGKFQLFVLGKEIEPGIRATTAEWPAVNLVLWDRYYWEVDSAPPGFETEYVDSQGIMKFPEWYYETNLKIRIVKQIRDGEGRYAGELAADFYKFDSYRTLFAPDGTPRRLNGRRSRDGQGWFCCMGRLDTPFQEGSSRLLERRRRRHTMNANGGNCRNAEVFTAVRCSQPCLQTAPTHGVEKPFLSGGMTAIRRYVHPKVMQHEKGACDEQIGRSEKAGPLTAGYLRLVDRVLRHGRCGSLTPAGRLHHSVQRSHRHRLQLRGFRRPFQRRDGERLQLHGEPRCLDRWPVELGPANLQHRLPGVA